MRLLWRAAQARRQEFAHRSGHRVALVFTVLLVVVEWLGQGFRGADIEGALRNVTWCTALSISATLAASQGGSDFDTLAAMRGQTRGFKELALPLARVRLAFSLHGGAALALGLGLLLRASSGALPGWLALLALVSTSLLGAIALTALAWLSTKLLPRFATIVFFAFLIVPTLLQTSLFEVPSLIDAWSRAIEWCTRRT